MYQYQSESGILLVLVYDIRTFCCCCALLTHPLLLRTGLSCTLPRSGERLNLILWNHSSTKLAWHSAYSAPLNQGVVQLRITAVCFLVMNSIECYWHAICILVRYRTSALDCSIRLWIRTWETWQSSESASLKARVQLRRRIWKPAVQRRDRCSQIVFQFHAAVPIKIFETDVWMTRDRRNSTLPSVLWSSLILFQLLSTGPPDPVCVSYTHDRDFGNFKEFHDASMLRHVLCMWACEDYPKGKENFRGRGWCPRRSFEYPGRAECQHDGLWSELDQVVKRPFKPTV